MEFSVVSTQGRVVTPAKIRERLRIKTGTRLVIELKEGGVEDSPITEATIDTIKDMRKREVGTQ